MPPLLKPPFLLHQSQISIEAVDQSEASIVGQLTNHSSPAHALLLRVGQLEAEVLEVAVGEQLLAAPAPRRVLVQTSGHRKIFLGPLKIFFTPPLI